VPELVQSFVEEARLARNLQHPGIARVYEFGVLRNQYFIAFEFVPGPTLQQLQQHCAATVGKIPVPVVLAIVAQLCDALDHAHTRRNPIGVPMGIVHRDVSPSNVIVSTSGQVKLIDFGLAKTKQSTVQSQVGVIKGKLSYVAPEYLTSGKLDQRCDLWALGVVMHELLTGQRLFDAPDNAMTLDRVRAMPIPPPSQRNPDVPPEVDKLVLTALNRDPEWRFPTAAKFRAAIAGLGGTQLTPQQLVQWVEWAFSQKVPPPREDSCISALQEIIESKPIALNVRDLPAFDAAMRARQRESVAAMPPLLVGNAMVERNRGSRAWIWVLLLLALVGGGVFAAHRYGAF
jgi:serine/threonine protein kinase